MIFQGFFEKDSLRNIAVKFGHVESSSGAARMTHDTEIDGTRQPGRPCTDPENFVRGGPTLATLFF